MRSGVSEDKTLIRDILDKAEVLWLALVDEDGPYSVPVNFAENDGLIYIHTGLRGRKAAALASGAQLAFSVAVDLIPKTGEDACAYGYKFRSVMGQGTPRAIDGEAAIAGLDAITLKYAGELLPYKEKVLGVTQVYAIDVATITARIKE
jgi:nitroimidazol reductase NimA-like FMN-containing flavoprotein (pyridoxamine 5'-phosphate oxidase superfamily)